jgi:hypothetical protein
MELPSASSLIGHIMYAARGVLVVILVTIVVLQAESGAPPQPPPPPQTPASGMTSSDSISAPTEVILATVQVTRSSSQQPDALSKLRRHYAPVYEPRRCAASPMFLLATSCPVIACNDDSSVQGWPGADAFVG